MRKVSEVLRLHHDVPSGAPAPGTRAIAQALGLSHATVGDYLRRAAHAGLAWPLPTGMTDADVEAMLFPPTAPRSGRPLPDWATVHHTLTTRQSATLQTQWEAYIALHPDGYGATRFRELYTRWTQHTQAVLRFEHVMGERVYVDYCGTQVELVDPDTGEVKRAQIFVGVLGASQYIFAEATWTQALPDWIGSHVRMLDAFQGVPRVITCDNLRSAVTKAHRYEPDLNPTYWEFATHYGVTILPARPRKPRDKSVGELAVKLVTQRVLDGLSERLYPSLPMLNQEMRTRVAALNARPFQQRPGSRQSVYETQERATLRPLPALPYEYAEWRHVTVGPDYHVRVDQHFYSVPHTLIKQGVDVRLTASCVEILHANVRVAGHVRNRRPWGFTTNPAHRPEGHTAHLQWTPERLVNWGTKIGPEVATLIHAILTRKYPHPDQGIRSCLGLLALEKPYGRERLNAACARAHHYERLSSRAVKAILDAGLDHQGLAATAEAAALPTRVHANVRGKRYFA
jgi:transposase